MKIIKFFNIMFPFNNLYKNILFYLSLSPIINFILTNIYYYNCGGYINNIYNFIYVLNPFTSSNPLCLLLITFMSGNLYLLQYIYIVIILFFISLFI